MQSAHPRALTGGCCACAEALEVGGCNACRCSVCQAACHGPLMYAHRLTHAMEHWKKSCSKEKKAATKASTACSEGLAAAVRSTRRRPTTAALVITIARIDAMCCKSTISIAGKNH